MPYAKPSTRRKLVAGNWKMHGSIDANRDLLTRLLGALDGISRVDVAVCVPAPYLSQVADILRGSAIRFGAQTASEFASGAYTGEVSCSMLMEFGCSYVITGHSERRALFGETNARVAAKFSAITKAGMTPLACVGETWPEREAGATEAVVAAQLDSYLAAADPSTLAGVVIAYEPVWAIGTGKTATPDQAQAAHAFIRARIARVDARAAAAVRILYGGSVNAANAHALFACADIDGGLVGGASLKVDEFAAICNAAT